MKKILFMVTLFFIVLFTAMTNVKAEGTVSANYISKDKITEGDIITIDINISNVSLSSDGKIYSFGGYIEFDKEYLEFISFEGKNGFDGLINTNNYKIALIDYTLSKGTKMGTIGTISFKALKSGSTTIGFRNPSSTDLEKNMDVTFSSKTINIKSKQVVNTKKEVKKVTTETIKEEVKEEIKKIIPSEIIEYFTKIQIIKNFIPYIKI